MSKVKFRASLKSRMEEICDANGWDIDSDQQRGHAFEDFVAELFIEKYSLDFDIDELVSRTNDAKVDILIEPSGDLESWLLIQCECGGLGRKSRPMKKDKVEAFFLKFENLIDEDWIRNQGFSQDRKNKLIDFSKWAQDMRPVRYIYVANKDEPSGADQLLNEVKKRIGADHYTNVAFEIIGEDVLSGFYSELTSVESEDRIPLKFNVPDNQFIFNTFGNHKMFLGLLKGSLVGEWQKSYKERLFDRNIRTLLSSGRINKAMAGTIEESPQEFLFFNNGITAICDKLVFDKNSRELTADGFSVINGAQTVGTIYASRHSNSLADVSVMVRIIETGYGELGSEITRYNNTQNVVNAADFKANDKVQKWLEEEFSNQKKTAVIPDLVYRRRRPYKRGKKGQTVLNIKELAKLRCLELKGSDILNSEPNKFWTSSDDGGYYDDLFSPKDGYFSPPEMNKIYLLFAAHDELEKRIAEKKLTNPERYFALKRFVWLAVDAFNKFSKEFESDYGGIDSLISKKSEFDEILSDFWAVFEENLDKFYTTEIIENNTSAYTLIRSKKMVSDFIESLLSTQKLLMRLAKK